jgi:hypothetical protein
MEACVVVASFMLGNMLCQKCRASLFKQMMGTMHREMAVVAKMAEEGTGEQAGHVH